MESATNQQNLRTRNPGIHTNAGRCPSRKAARKSTFYKRGLRLLFLTILAVSILCTAGCGSEGKAFTWSNLELSPYLPEPTSHIGKILSDSKRTLSIYVQKTMPNDYDSYLNACKNAGYTIESDKSSSDYQGFNEAGYELYLRYDSDDKEMYVSLDAPQEMGVLVWPESGIASLLPTPSSAVGHIQRESSDGFYAYVGETAKEDFDSYVNMCIANGFSVDYSKGETFYHGENADGCRVSVIYQGNRVISIEIKANQKTESEAVSAAPAGSDTSTPPTDETQSAPATGTGAAESTADAKPTVSDTQTAVPAVDADPDKTQSAPAAGTGAADDEIRPEFKAAMDSYEAFCDEYCDFMKKYAENPADLAMLAKYADMMTKYSEMNKNFEAWDESEMSEAELKYYLEVLSRVTQKLADAAN